MFDSGSPDVLVEMIGDRLRTLAHSDQALDEFERTQALSASSVARYLAREMRAADRELEAMMSSIIEDVAAAEPAAASAGAVFGELAERLTLTKTIPRGESYSAAVGAALSAVLAALRGDASGDAEIGRLQATLRHRLAELADRHVEILSTRKPTWEGH